MRISDWSSDVCSSDLVRVPPKSLSMGVAPLGAGSEGRTITAISGSSCVRGGTCSVARPGWRRCLRGRPLGRRLGRHLAPPSRRNSRLPAHAPRQRRHCHCPVCEYRPSRHERSEEHTSELQSLMRISYAVFCLKKKKKITNTDTHEHNNNS